MTTSHGELALDFCGLRIAYDDRVLQPRPWTELQSRWAAELAASAGEGRLLELCSGAGHIGLGAAALSGRAIVCVDVDPAAVELTRRNADDAGLGDRVELRLSALQEALAEGEVFALVIADPPWVRSGSLSRYPDDPALAIDGGADGLDLAHACVEASRGHLRGGGSLLLQLGTPEQADAVSARASEAGWVRGAQREGDGGVVLRLLHP